MKTRRLSEYDLVIQDLIWINIFYKKYPDWLGLGLGLAELKVPKEERDLLMDEVFKYVRSV